MISLKRLWQRKVVKTPSMLQMEVVECGAVALRIILAYFGRYVPLTELRQACRISRDGSNLQSIINAANGFNLDAYLYCHNLDQVKQLQPPFIVYWGFNHFVIIEGFKKNRVYLNDPANGHRTVSMQEFSDHYTGIALAFEPGANFSKGGHKPQLLRVLLKHLRDNVLTTTFLLLTGFALIIPGVLLPLFSKIFVNEYLILHIRTWLPTLLIGMLLTAIIRGVLTWLQSYYLARFSMLLSIKMASQFFWHVLHLPKIFFSQRSAGDLTQRFGICDRLAQLIANNILATFLGLFTVLFYAILMCLFNFKLAIISIAITSINAWIFYYALQYQANINKNLSRTRGKLYGLAMNGLQVIETYKASGQENQFFSQWAGLLTKLLNAQQISDKINQNILTLNNTLVSINNILVLGIGGYAVMHGNMSVGTLVAFQSLLASFMLPFTQLVKLNNKLSQAEGDLNLIDDIIHYPARPTISDINLDTDQPSKLSGHLQMINVTFGYSKHSPPILQDFNLDISPGMRVAIVGSSRSGRSTISRLIMGLYEPWSGEILLDGKPLNQYPRELIANSLALVNQDDMLFEGTVRDNICLWDDTISRESILAATKDAVIHDLIVNRKGGYRQTIREGGVNFSGGERQRIELARALAINPTLLILDEATSALDSEVEMIINKNIQRRGCACLIIAHRLHTIRHCDEIIVLDQGLVIQRGTHEQLIEQSQGLYAKLFASSKN